MDAAALVAYLDGEPGREVVRAEIAGAAASSVNLAEVLGRTANRGGDPQPVSDILGALGLVIQPFTDLDALEAARMAPLTKSLGLSLADRACLALAARLGATVLTADRQIARANLGVPVELIR